MPLSLLRATITTCYLFKIEKSDEAANVAGGQGGKRPGAGRRAGSGWKPCVANLRIEAVEQMRQIVGSDRDPLAIVIEIACDPKTDRQTRLGACSIALPYLYPKLSATTVTATHVSAQIDAGELMQRIAERIGRLVPGAPTITAEKVPT